MPARKLSMRKIKEILRLSWGCQQSQRQVALQCGVSRPCVGEYLRRASDAGLSWPLPQELDDAQLDRLLFPPTPKLCADHRKHEPAGSKLDVFLYQGAKAERKAWDAKLPELESNARQAQIALTDWKDVVKDGAHEKTAVWKAFTEKAPDAANVNRMVLASEQKQAQFTKELRAYHRMEKSLESNLGGPLHKKIEQQRRDQLLKQFGKTSYRDRLPAAIRVQAAKHRESVKQAREQQRSLSRSRGKGLGL